MLVFPHTSICDGIPLFQLLQLVVSGGQTCPQVSEPHIARLNTDQSSIKLKIH